MIASTLLRRLLAVGTCAALSIGAVACAEDQAPTPSSSATSESTTALSTTETTAASSEASEKTESVELTTSDGNVVLVPAAFAEGVAEHESDWGQPQTVQQAGDGIAATFENGDRVIYSEATGAVPLLGMIGQAWEDQGGLNGQIGLPTEPEAEVEGGWRQAFQNGSIAYVDDGNGEFSAHVEQ